MPDLRFCPNGACYHQGCQTPADCGGFRKPADKAVWRAMCAGPALLAAAKGMLDTTHICGVDCDPNQTCPVGDALRAAITLAEGDPA